MSMQAFYTVLTTIDPADHDWARWRRLATEGRRDPGPALAFWFNWA